VAAAVRTSDRGPDIRVPPCAGSCDAGATPIDEAARAPREEQPVHAELVADPGEFLRRSSELRAREPVLTNVIGTVVQGIADGRQYDQAWFWLVLDDAGTVVGCASRTAPWNLLLGPMPAAAAAVLAPAVVAADPQVPGVVGPDEVARAFADALPGQRLDVTMREVVRVLDDLVEPPDVPGEAQVARSDELPVLVEWYRQFGADAGLPLHDVEQSVATRLGVGALLWWNVNGVHVSLAGHTTPVQVPGGAVGRIGPVYTPLEHRRHGYAAALTTAVTRRLLTSCSVVMLFADADNATSNGVYERLGFRSTGEVVEAAIVAAQPTSAGPRHQ
jgi:FR47-like protein